MVNVSKLERVLVGLLMDNCSNRDKAGWRDYIYERRKLNLYKARKPSQYSKHLNVIVSELEALKRESVS